MATFLSILTSRARSSASFDPTRDWLITLLTAGILLIGIIGWNIWAFDTVTYGGALGQTAPSTTQIFDHSTLDAIHAIFQNRGDEELKYQSGTYTFTDPSQ